MENLKEYFNSFENSLSKISDEKKPSWGILTPQHMIEHLSGVVAVSTGKVSIPPFADEEKMLSNKNRFFENLSFPKNVPINGEYGKLRDLRFSSLQEACQVLTDQVKLFIEMVESNPDQQFLHPVLGVLNLKEWEIFHLVHFNHHFEQFDLLDA